MAEVQKGFFWHVHHEVLIEWCYNYNERASFIRTDKRESEQETRLRLFKPVKGTLPREVGEALQALDKAWRAYGEALRKNMPAIEALHKKECHNCPWDGKTIFPGS